ncbi:MAG: hypothetical protein Q7R62_00650 [bacterium]|nr:hypothetical protein [bacterium]
MTWQLSVGYIFFLVLVLWFAFVIMNHATHRRFWNHRRYELLLITVPLGSEVQPFAAKHKLSEIGATAEFFQRLANYQITFAVEAAVHHVGEEIHFYIYAPKKYKKEIVQDVESLFPGAKVKTGDYDIWMEGSEIEISHVRQSKPFLVPLSSAVVPTPDTFTEILRRLSQIRVIGEGVALQWIIKPLSSSIKKQCVELVSSLKSGTARSFKLLDEGFLVTPQTIGVLEEKLTSQLYSVNCRLIVAHASRDEAKRLLRDIGEAFSRASSGMLYNELYLVPAKKPNRSLAMFINRTFDEKEEMILNAQEIAGLFHFPTRRGAGLKAR